jgi:hypothetical protein
LEVQKGKGAANPRTNVFLVIHSLSLLKISLVVVGKYLGEKPYFGNWASVPSVCFSHGTSV